YHGSIRLRYGVGPLKGCSIIVGNIPAVPIPNFTGNFYNGCGLNSSGVKNEFYNGMMDDFTMIAHIAQNLEGQFDSLLAVGGQASYVNHEDFCFEMVRAFCQILRDHPQFGDNLFFGTLGSNTAAIRAAGRMSSDGIFCNWQQTDNSNFQPQLCSPMQEAGANLGYTTDYAGMTVASTPN